MEAGEQILKCRDDHEPLRLSRTGDGAFALDEDRAVAWAADSASVSKETLRKRIEPWLTAIVRAEHLGLLVGSGLTHAAHRHATDQGLPGMVATSFNVFGSEIDAAAKLLAARAGRETGNIEDQFRAATELWRGLEVLGLGGKELPFSAEDLGDELSAHLSGFAATILEAEKGILEANEDRRAASINLLVSFLMSFASRTGTRDRLQIFTTNYDRYIEAAADVAGLHLLDRFVGSLNPVFRSSRLAIDLHYNPPGIRGEPRFVEGVARFTKLHGSIDWIDSGRSIVRAPMPFGADDIDMYVKPLVGDGGAVGRSLMVYPNSSKDQETVAYPYVELFRDFAAAVCRPHSAVVCYGYGFGDEHVNRVIEDMLTIPSTHLVIISWDDPLGRIMQLYERIGRDAQITLLLGDHLGDLQTLVDLYLPKPAIDTTTTRMADLLKMRWGATDRAAAGDGGTLEAGS